MQILVFLSVFILWRCQMLRLYNVSDGWMKEWKSMENEWSTGGITVIDEIHSTRWKPCLGATLSITNLTRTDRVSNQNLLGDKPTINRLKPWHGPYTAIISNPKIWHRFGQSQKIKCN